jgi:hypothetical protein
LLEHWRIKVTGEKTGRNVVCVLLGVIGLVLKSHYNGPLTDIFQSYFGNVSISFATYFLVLQPAGRLGVGKLPAAVVALLLGEAFEMFDGFGIMTNVYDPFDFLANAAGVGLAFASDITMDRVFRRRHAQSAPGHNETSAV